MLTALDISRILFYCACLGAGIFYVVFIHQCDRGVILERRFFFTGHHQRIKTAQTIPPNKKVMDQVIVMLNDKILFG
ncbi:hypothetical protein D3C79_946620 [compost metagenome]